MKANVGVRNVVLDLNPGGSRVVVVKLPRGDRAVILYAALYVDHTCGPKIRPREFFFARPDKLHWFAGGFR